MLGLGGLSSWVVCFNNVFLEGRAPIRLFRISPHLPRLQESEGEVGGGISFSGGTGGKTSWDRHENQKRGREG